MHGNHACCQNDLGGDYNRIEPTHLAEVDLESVFLKFSPSSSNATARGLASYGRNPICLSLEMAIWERFWLLQLSSFHRKLGKWKSIEKPCIKHYP